MIACDYCHFHRCRWTKHTAGDPPENCPGNAFFSISDTYLEKDEFRRRVDIARRIARYNSAEKVWYLDPTRNDPFTGYDLKRVIEVEVNNWSPENDLNLMDVIEYVGIGFESAD